jgi:isoleucyl-tRNA synthetase
MRRRLENWERLMPVRDDVLKELEAARQEKFIGAPLEARVRLVANGDLYPLLAEYESELPALFIVSQVSIEKAEQGPLAVRVERAGGSKCERCWKYTEDVGADPDWPAVCAPCAGAVREILAGQL